MLSSLSLATLAAGHICIGASVARPAWLDKDVTPGTCLLAAAGTQWHFALVFVGQSDLNRPVRQGAVGHFDQQLFDEVGTTVATPDVILGLLFVGTWCELHFRW